jgi:hypothetical protein
LCFFLTLFASELSVQKRGPCGVAVSQAVCGSVLI